MNRKFNQLFYFFRSSALSVIIVFTLSCQSQKSTLDWFNTLPTLEKSDPEFLKGPYLQNVTPNSIEIMWESEQPYVGKVQYGKGESLGNNVTETDSNTIHKLKLTGLDIETEYFYQVVASGKKTSIYHFKTAVDTDNPFSFASYGDSRNGSFNHLKNSNLILSKKPNFVVHNGDFVERGSVYKEWDKYFFAPAKNLLNNVPLIPVIGNHEDNHQNFYDFFSLPNNTQYFSFNYGNAHFIVLDTEVIDEFSLDKSDPNSIAAYEKSKIFFDDIIDPVAATKYYSKGKKAYKNEEYKTAIDFLSKAYESDTTCAEALGLMSECFASLGEHDRAIESAHKSIKLLPNFPNSYFGLINVYTAQKKYDLAIEWCKKLYDIEPDKPGAFGRMAEIYSIQEKYDLAIQAMKKALQILPSEYELYIKLGKLFEKTGNLDAAFLCYQRGLNWYPSDEKTDEIKQIQTKVDQWTN